MKYLITGGAGFIGSNMLKYLIKNINEFDTICILDNLYSGRLKNIDKYLALESVSFINEDIASDNAFKLMVEYNPDVIFHMAARVSVTPSFKYSQDYFKTNVLGTQNMLEVARICKSKFLFSSSSSVYGNKMDETKETDNLNPISPYAMTKKLGEDLVSFYNKIHNVETCNLRYFNVYGPNQSAESEYSGVISLFAKMKMNGSIPNIYGDGNQVRDFTYVEDICNINYLMSKQTLTGDVFNTGPGHKTSLNKLVNIFNFEKVNYKEDRKGDIRFSNSDSSKLINLLKYSFKYDIKRGISKYLKHLYDNKMEEI